jgi:hypothetical protein
MVEAVMMVNFMMLLDLKNINYESIKVLACEF